MNTTTSLQSLSKAKRKKSLREGSHVRKNATISDIIKTPPSLLTKLVREKILHTQEGKPFSNKDFLPLGSRAAMDKALSRLVKSGIIERVARGVFMRPKISNYVATTPPNIDEVIQKIATRNKETVLVHGAEAARRLGLTTQVPGKVIFHTSGVTRTLRVGTQIIHMRHCSPKKLQLADKPAGLALSALLYLGKDGVTNEAIEKVKNRLGMQQYKLILHSTMPGWLRENINKFEKTNK